MQPELFWNFFVMNLPAAAMPMFQKNGYAA